MCDHYGRHDAYTIRFLFVLAGYIKALFVGNGKPMIVGLNDYCVGKSRSRRVHRYMPVQPSVRYL